MRKPDLVSIIVPTYNREHLLGATLDSVLLQTYDKWECLIIDDGSTDNTEALVKSYILKDKRFQYYKRPAHMAKGGNTARNYGFEMSQGEFVQWFDDDDVMLPDFLNNKLKALTPKIEFVIAMGFITDEYLNTIGVLTLNRQTSLYKGFVLWQNKIVTGCVLFRSEFLENKRLFKDNIIRGQETEFFSRMFYKIEPYQYVLVEESLFYYRQHDSTKTKQNEVYNKAFKTSEIYVAIQNIKCGIQMEDKQIIQFFYRVLINFFFRAVEQRDYENSKELLRTLVPLLKPLNKSLSLQLSVVGPIFVPLGRSIYTIEMYFKKYQI